MATSPLLGGERAPTQAPRPAIRSRVASASRIAAIRNLTLHRRPSRQSHRVRTAAHEERLAKKARCKLAPRFCHKRSRFGSVD